ncbi:MAG TPA: DUF2219 family protein [Flavobacteriaceae bacterium]|nr:DUF2219 family protein [Flavobacteriaceae bacterium]MCB9213901.1 DUF2219 family protein [Alteromonas sp.]HPF11114.1 DUF2219 family protein [Flavobacteriaceae bacterium]HQU21218.1 DUF2219 family protein [Flavobacteriaceae bacterium]HQU65690.1 DUF2219 family protein [Flavobacteriaceae bacterium]
MPVVIKHLILSSFMLCCQVVQLLGQESISVTKNQLEIHHDNDFFLLTDRYYTFGLALAYTRSAPNGFFTNSGETFRFELSQKAFTPNNLETIEISEMDRPYAGVLSLKSGWTKQYPKALLQTSFELALMGPASGVGTFQQWYHDHIVKYKTPTWAHELENKFHANIYLAYATEWQWTPNPFSVHVAAHPQVVIGTLDTYIQPELQLFFGRRSALKKSMAYHQLDDAEREIYFSLEGAYRNVFKNARINDNAINSGMWLLGFQFHHRYKKNEYRVGYHFQTPEATNLRRHQYLSLGYARGF